MLRTTTINIFIIIVLAFNSQATMAQPGYGQLIFERETNRKPYDNPLSRLQNLIEQSEIYEYLLGHPKVIKLQDMAQRVWEKQTGNKRRVVTWSRRNIISQDELPVRTPYQ